jgi:A/G-specific adenine glycosylase
VAEHYGKFPTDRAALQNLPGIGPYTSAAIASIAFDHAETVVDGNVERVMARLFDLHVPLPKSKGALTSLAASLTPQTRPGDYAQAVMDLGATICTPKSPRCALCPWHSICAARKAGTAADLPRKLPKLKKPTRFGTAYVARRSDGAVLLERRPERGLLGGMLGWPGSEWHETLTDAIPPIQANWVEAPGEVRHTFTHFHLRLRVMVAEVEAHQTNQTFIAAQDFRPADLPTVMRKIWSMAAAET